MSAPQPQGRRYFTSHFRLLGLVNELALSPGARVTLTRCLRRAKPLGQYDAGPGEGCFWTTTRVLADETGLTLVTLHRRLAELRAESLVRWRVVHPRQPLPNGAPADGSCSVFYVNVRALDERLGTGTELARADHIDQSRVINLISPDPLAYPTNPQKTAPSLAPSLSLNHRLNLTKISDHGSRVRATRAAAPSGAPDRGSGFQPSETRTETKIRSESESDAAAIFAHWYERLGGPHGLNAQGPAAVAVRKVVAQRLGEHFTPRDLFDAIDAASDPRIGGAYKLGDETPWQWCQNHHRFDAAIFRGPIEKLIDSARKVRAADEKRANAAARMPHESPGASVAKDARHFSKDAPGSDAWQQTPTAETLRAELAEALRTGGRRRA